MQVNVIQSYHGILVNIILQTQSHHILTYSRGLWPERPCASVLALGSESGLMDLISPFQIPLPCF